MASAGPRSSVQAIAAENSSVLTLLNQDGSRKPLGKFALPTSPASVKRSEAVYMV